MGAALASQCYVQWKHLPDRPFRLLVHMALTCLDDDKEPKYFGGREMLALALGLPESEPTSHQMVSRAIRLLIESGAIERVTVGRPGQRAEYLLTLSRRRRVKVDPPVPLPVVKAPRIRKARDSDLDAARARLDDTPPPPPIPLRPGRKRHS